MKRRTLLALGSLPPLALLTLALLRSPAARRPMTERSSAAPVAPRPSSREPTPTASPAPSAGAEAPAQLAAGDSRAARRQRADAVRARLRQELGASAQPGATRTGTSSRGAEQVHRAAFAPRPLATAETSTRMPALEGSGNQAERPLGKYIRETVQQQFIPLAAGCYDELLRREPSAQGKLVLELEVVGDESVGGVVNDVSLGEGSTLSDPELETCVTESLYSTLFDAPPDGEHSVTITYPIELQP
ncbi:MAG TPA: AgmX/PglI C-terminal domain-containing protein [Polyangiaceae bacterium]|nr:AgmX/PglI C-terminal domain-containing protein [Polyangiaceae bacterium]